MIELLGKFGLGLLVGALCGAIPLVVGLLTDSKVSGIVGAVFCTLSGILFSFLNKSPFIAAIVAILFIIFIFVGNKKHISDSYEQSKTASDDNAKPNETESASKNDNSNSEN